MARPTIADQVAVAVKTSEISDLEGSAFFIATAASARVVTRPRDRGIISNMPRPRFSTA